MKDFSAIALLSISLLFIGIQPVSGQAEPSDQPTEAENSLTRAESWYSLARVTTDDLYAYQQSLDSFERALELLEDSELPTSQALYAQAQAGHTQAQSRINNTHSSYRNAIQGVWWIAGDDPTAVSHGAAESRAVTHTVEPMLDFLERIADDAPQSAAIVRTNIELPEHIIAEYGLSSTDLRNGALAQLDTSNLVQAITDDRGIQAAGDSWFQIIAPETPQEEVAKLFRESFDSDHLLIFDLTAKDFFYRDPESQSVPIWRLDGRGVVWNLKELQTVGQTTTQGLAQDQSGRTGNVLVWAFLMILVAALLVTVSWRLEKHTHNGAQVGLGAAILLALMVFLVGMSLTATASQFTASFIPDWDYETFLYHQGWLTVPHPIALLWQLVHGAFVMLGPMIALGWATLKIPTIAPYLVPKGIEPERLLALVGPFAQAGASTWLFGSMIVGDPGSLTSTALPLGVAACLCGFALVRPMADLLAGDTDTARKAVAATLGGIGLLLILPFGLYLNWAWGTGLVVSAMSIGGAVLSFTTEPSTQEATKPDESRIGQPTGTIRNPKWIPTVDIEQIAVDIEAGNSIKLDVSEYSDEPTDMIRAGMSRTTEEIVHNLEQRDYEVLRIDPGTEPLPAFSLIAQLLEATGITDSNLSARLDKRETALDAFGSLDNLVSELPGVGAIFGILEQDADQVSIQRERVIADGAELLLQGLSNAGVDILIIEDLQIADDSSLEILKRALLQDKLNTRLVAAFEGESPEKLETLLESIDNVSPHSIEPFSDEQGKEFIIACGIFDLPDDIIEVVYEGGRKYPGSMHSILQALIRDDLLIPDDETDTFRPVEDISVSKVRQAYDELNDAELRRISSLQAEERLILECGALCGRNFTIDQISAGLQWSPVKVTAMLRDLEASEQFPLIQDSPGREGQFRFNSSVTREVLVESLGDNSEHRRELARTIHDRIARASSEYHISLDRRLHHALRAGQQATPLVLELAAEQLEQYVQQCAWPEVNQALERIDGLRGLGAPDPETRVDLAECAYLRVIGGQQHRDRLNDLARHRLENRLDEGFEDSLTFRVAYTWCEGVFEEHQQDDMELLEQTCSKLIENVSNPTLEGLFQFYLILVRQSDEETRRELANLEDSIRSDLDDEQRENRLLLSMVVNTRGNWLLKLNSDDAEERQRIEDKALSFLTEAAELKKELGDIKGLAMNYGIRGSKFLFDKHGGPESIAKARHWLEKDLELIDEHGMESDRSGVENKLSMCSMKQAEHADGDERASLLREAAHYADRSFDDALSLGRETDLAFAATQRIAVWFETLGAELADSDEGERIDRIMTTMADLEIWEQVRDGGFAKNTFVEQVPRVIEERGEQPWMVEIQNVVEYLTEEESAA